MKNDCGIHSFQQIRYSQVAKSKWTEIKIKNDNSVMDWLLQTIIHWHILILQWIKKVYLNLEKVQTKVIHEAPQVPE